MVAKFHIVQGESAMSTAKSLILIPVFKKPDDSHAVFLLKVFGVRQQGKMQAKFYFLTEVVNVCLSWITLDCWWGLTLCNAPA